MKPNHFLQLKDFSRDELDYLFLRTRWIKDRFKRYEIYQPLRDRTLAMVFEKASTRTRVSFEAGMNQLGGIAINLNRGDTQLSRGEPIEDLARVISRMVDIVMIRTFEQTLIERFAAHSRVPVINGLTNEYHPCQILADIYTYIEHRGSLQGKTIAWIGDSNNMCNTWLQAAAIFDFKVHVSTPPGYEIDPACPEMVIISSPLPIPSPRVEAPAWSPPTSGPAWASRPRTRNASVRSRTGWSTPK
jgi:ornithine carbamoyltransferase